MAVQGPIPVEFATVFPRGVFAAGPFEPVRDFEASKDGRFVQSKDKATGLPMWVAEVIDGDPEARVKSLRVKVAAADQPVLPAPHPGMPFVPVEFARLTITPYVNQAGRLAYSLKAPRRPRRSPGGRSGKRRKGDGGMSGGYTYTTIAARRERADPDHGVVLPRRGRLDRRARRWHRQPAPDHRAWRRARSASARAAKRSPPRTRHIARRLADQAAEYAAEIERLAAQQQAETPGRPRRDQHGWGGRNWHSCRPGLSPHWPGKEKR